MALSLCVILLYAVAVRCGWGRIFWEDEMLGWMLLRDPSWNHMLWSWRQGADGGGISFYLLGRLWLRAFGTSVLAYRMFSTTCFAAAFVIVWSIMRRFYSPGVVAFCSLAVWLVSPALVRHMTEGRFYGLLIAVTAAVMWLVVQSAQRVSCGWRFCAAIFLANSLLVTTHQLGIVYSFVLTAAMAGLDLLALRWRPRLYLAAMLPWLLLLACLPAIKATASVGKPYFWTVQPKPLEFLLLYTGFTPTIGLLLLVIAACCALAQRQSMAAAFHLAYARRQPIYMVAGALICVPILLLLEGTIGPPLAISRYLQPVALATMLLMAEMLTLAQPLLGAVQHRFRAAPAVGWFLFLSGLAAYDFSYRPRHTTLLQDYTPALTASLPKGVPVICEDAFAFTELISRQHDSGVQYTYLLDWEHALSSEAPRLEVTQYHLMQNWKKVGYFSGSIRHAAEFFHDTPEFYIVSFSDIVHHPLSGRSQVVARLPVIGSDLHERLAADPGYRVTRFEVLTTKESLISVWQACREAASACADATSAVSR